MANQLITPPAREAITLDVAKHHLRVTHTDDDALISELIPAARRFAEGYTRRAFITQTWNLLLDGFPAIIRVPMPPLQAVASINYVDAAGVSQLLDAADYQVDAITEPARIALRFGETWPQTYDELNVVTVQFTAGYGDNVGDVPATIRSAMLMHIAHMYEHRESTVAGVIVTKVPFATEYLLDPYRVMQEVN